MSSNSFFYRTKKYIDTINDITVADPLDKMIAKLISDENAYERASQALRRRFVRGAEIVDAIDRSARKTRIKREVDGGSYRYKIEGLDGSWSEPEERIWVVAMYALWQESQRT